MTQAEPTYYRTIADADNYFSSQLYATDWTGASDDDKEKALIMATRAVDSLKYAGVKRSLWKALIADGGDSTKTSEYLLADTELTALEIEAAEASQVRQFPRNDDTGAESWVLQFTGTSGDYTLTFDGATTGTLARAADAADILTALEALSTVPSGGLTVEVQSGGTDGGGVGGPYVITTAGDLATSEYNTLSVDTDIEGGTVITLNDNVPDPIAYAVFEEARSLLSGRDAEQEFRNLALTSDGIGSNRVTMDRSGLHPEHTAHMVTSPLAWKYVQRYLAKNNTFTIRRS